MSILRLLVKLADLDSNWSKQVARIPSTVSLLARISSLYHGDVHRKSPDILSASHDLNATRLDIMCLALALITSLMHDDHGTRSLIFSTRKRLQ